ncbi:MAG: flagellar basal body rod protein FlgB [Burkholderiaceae bacterium]|uniref:Flagellar basal body rod protein FlgB n=1 Tax=Rubrivivax albus TaxID=2499835 RepID=A0A3S2TTB0_9BURK|nr:flagellar basal body rod protein FlgB [Rubrivivax albus]MCB1997433.1 flagellar basal body rod protein FlgB [Rhodoferax sp.]MCP5272135.1 flagellar basal body rod protein FlgB [Burkholderiaceae bacterium]RVT54337.1 flagellar basal body rod protein FlgB [Rubrivivax albus]
MLNRLGASIDFQSQALLLRSERQRLLASNIANADTPGYQARDFDFRAALGAATAAAGGAKLGDPIAPKGGMAPGVGVPATQAPTMRYATPAQNNLDGNTVDMDRERASFADNALRYEATLKFINGSLRTLHDAMKSHTQA